ncbi:MAG: hypothetical protein ABL308_09980 [Oceanicaulis sp.]
MSKPNYQFIDATFWFFKTFGRRPLSVLWIAFWQVLLYAGLSALVLWLLWPFFEYLVELSIAGEEPEPSEMLARMGGVMAAYLLAMLGFLVSALMIQAAWLRLMTRDELAAVIPFRFGSDELRLLGVNVLFIVFNVLAWTAVTVVFIVLNGALFAAAGEDAGAGAVVGGALGNTLLVLVVVVAAIILMIRFAAAPAMSIRDNRFRLFESFTATGGITGGMFLSYLLLIVLIFGVFLLVSAVQQVVGLLMAADLVGSLTALENEEDPAVVFSILAEAFTQPGALIGFGVIILIQVIAQVLVDASWHGVGAYAAVRHAGDLDGTQEAVSAPAGSVGGAPSEG